MIHPDRLRMMGRSSQPELNTSTSGPLPPPKSSGQAPEPVPPLQQPQQPPQQPQQKQQTTSAAPVPNEDLAWRQHLANQAAFAGVPAFGSRYGVAPTPVAAASPYAAAAYGYRAAQPVASASQPKTVGEWTQYTTPDGRCYYFNSRTQATQWNEPAEFHQPPVPPPPPAVSAPRPSWTTYKDQSSGKEYYYNTVTKQSVWEKPAELIQFEAAQAPQPSAGGEAANAVKDTQSAAAAPTQSASAPVQQKSEQASVRVNESSEPASLPQAGSPDADAAVPPSAPADSCTAATAAAAAAATAVAAALSAAAAAADSIAAAESTAASEEGVASEAVASGSVAADNNVPEVLDTAAPSAPVISAPIVVSHEDNESAAQDDLETVVVDPMLVTPFKPAGMYSTKEEAQDAFMSLLRDREVGSSWTWEQALPKIITDKRYSAFSTLSERKRVFDRYREKRAEEEEDLREKKLKEARDGFSELLRSDSRVNCTMRFVEAATLLGRDPRFTAVESSRERERLFYEYLDKRDEEEREQRRATRAKNEAQFRALLLEQGLKGDAQWRDVHRSVADDDRAKGLNDMERLKVFEEVIKGLRHEEDQKALLAQNERRQALRRQREQYRALLEEKFQSETGDLHLRTIWKDFASSLRDDERFSCFDKPDVPQQLFDDFCDELEERLRSDRKLLKAALKELDVSLQPDANVPQLCTKLFSECSTLKSSAPAHIRALLYEYIDAAESKAKRAARKQNKYEAAFVKLVQRKVANPELPWSQAQDLLEHHTAFRKLDKAARLRLYEAHVEQLRQSSADRSGSDSKLEPGELRPSRRRRSKRSRSRSTGRRSRRKSRR